MVYRLYHMNVQAKDGRPIGTDIKILGYYSSIENAIAAQERYRKKDGFCDFKYGFGVEVLCDRAENSRNMKSGYAIGYVDLTENLEFFLGGYYSNKDSANRAFKAISRLRRFNNSSENLGVYEFTIDEDASWVDGFKTVYQLDTGSLTLIS